VHLDVVLQRVVVDVIWTHGSIRSQRQPFSILAMLFERTAACLDDVRRLHSGTDSFSNCSPYFIPWALVVRLAMRKASWDSESMYCVQVQNPWLVQ
jgi:hypothetical protein